MNKTCKAKTKAGKPCKAIPYARGLCAFHADPRRAAELGRMGGQKNRRLIADSASEAISAPRTAEDVKNLLAETMAGIHARRLDPKIGNVMAYLGTAREQTGYIPTAAFVNAYLGLGDHDQAFAWLERAYQEHSDILKFLKVHPFFDPLRGDPRFADLVRRVGLDQAR